ncbi:jg25693, partial [Pararge aegeria aegeria]
MGYTVSMGFVGRINGRKRVDLENGVWCWHHLPRRLRKGNGAFAPAPAN